jgi:LmbE family N-acetylglucosaminyl deacetylase
MELLWPEEGSAWKVHGVYVRTTEEVNTWIDIGDTIDLKIKALREHHSQLDDYKELEETIRQRSAEAAATAGKEQGMAFAENFRVVRLKE